MDITARLRGKLVAEVVTNGHVLQIRTHDGAVINVAWVDDNGEPLKGKPVVESRGFRLRAEGARDLIQLPR